MAIEFEGNSIETSANGFLVDHTQWSEGLAEIIAKEEGIELTEKHWDLINYLREEYINNNGNQPNTRNIMKAMGAKWGAKLAQKDL